MSHTELTVEALYDALEITGIGAQTISGKPYTLGSTSLEEIVQAVNAAAVFNDVSPLESGRQASQGDANDAARWRALLNSARIRPLGSAGIRVPEERHYAHLGLELWMVFGKSLTDEAQRVRLAEENALGREWLIGYADIAELAQQAAPQGEGK